MNLPADEAVRLADYDGVVEIKEFVGGTAAKRGPICEDVYGKQAYIGMLDRHQDTERAARSLIKANRILDASRHEHED